MKTFTYSLIATMIALTSLTAPAQTPVENPESKEKQVAPTIVIIGSPGVILNIDQSQINAVPGAEQFEDEYHDETPIIRPLDVGKEKAKSFISDQLPATERFNEWMEVYDRKVMVLQRTVTGAGKDLTIVIFYREIKQESEPEVEEHRPKAPKGPAKPASLANR